MRVLLFLWLATQSHGLRFGSDPDDEAANRLLTKPLSEREITEWREALRWIRSNFDGGSDGEPTEPKQRDHQQVCSGFEYAKGSWEQSVGKPKKSFICCNSFKKDQVNHPDTCGEWGADWRIYQQGEGHSWRALDEAHKPAGTVFTAQHDNSCSCEQSWEQRLGMSQREMFEWQPSDCRMEAFNADKFCALLGERRVAIVGDSTSRQAAQALRNMVLGGSADGIACAERIGMLKSDTLVYQQGEADDADERVGPFDFDTFRADIIVFGVGPHIHSLDKFDSMLEQVAAKVKAYRSSNNRPVRFFWKTTGGAGCGPINTLNYDSGKPEWTWDLFPVFDKRARQAMANLSVPVLDVSPLYLRGDGHNYVDCMHFCQPGPLNIFSRVFQHVLQEIETEEAQGH